MKSHSHMELHRVQYWHQCFLRYAVHHSALSSLVISIFMPMSLSASNAKESLEKLQHRGCVGLDANTYPKHVGHAFIISVTCVEFEKVCP